MGFEDRDAGNYDEWEPQRQIGDVGLPVGPQQEMERTEADFILEELWGEVRNLGPINRFQLQDMSISFENGDQEIFDVVLTSEQADTIASLLAEFYVAVDSDSAAFYDGLCRLDLYFNGGSDSSIEGTYEFPAFSHFFLNDLLPTYISDAGLANWVFEISEDLSPRANGINHQLNILNARVTGRLTESHYRYLSYIDIRTNLVQNENLAKEDKAELIQRIYDSFPARIRPLEEASYAMLIVAIQECPDTPQDILDGIAANEGIQEILENRI